MEYDLFNVKSLKMDGDSETITVETDKGQRVFTRDEIETVKLKSVAFMDGDTYFFNNARCSIDRQNKELVCGD